MIRLALLLGAVALAVFYFQTGRIDVVPLPIMLFAGTTGLTLWAIARL
ncbi:MAG: hypothetical protein R3D02_04270 [Hyphomicrobiales bacterium]